uniref:NDUFA1 n=1 Tax=Euglena gracilis TaxID=3039 RepID=UPI002FE4FB34
MPGGGGWSNMVPIIILNGVVWAALGRASLACSPPEFHKRTKNDTEFNKYLHLRFNKAVQNPESVAGQAVKAGCAPEFRPFDSPANPLVVVYGWKDEIQPRPNPGSLAQSFDDRGLSWYQSHFSNRVVDDPKHNSLPFPGYY